MIPRLALVLLPILIAAVSPIPEDLVCPTQCKCSSAMSAAGTSIPADFNGSSGPISMPYVGSSNYDCSGPTSPRAEVTLTGQGAGWGPSNGQCNKLHTVCETCGYSKCTFKVNVVVDITQFCGLPASGSYRWTITLPGTPPTGEIDPNSGDGEEELVDRSLDCGDGVKTYNLQVWRYDTNPAEKLFETTFSVTCVDCNPNT